MQTEFSPVQRRDPAIVSSEAVIRKCVHCGFCTATCPTYVLLGDELDSPRGRIYLIKDMLENDAAPTAEVVKHIDRCLSCLSCVTACPSGVNYAHLIDHARAYIEARYRRPVTERFFRWLLAKVLPYPGRFRLALNLARLTQPLKPVFRGEAFKPLRAMLDLVPKAFPVASGVETQPATAPKGRVLMLKGCVEPVLRPDIQAAAVRLLHRCGYDVAYAPEAACCGSLSHHMGREDEALAFARANIDAWTHDEGDIAPILVTASGCGTTVKDYGFMLRNDPAYAEKAARISALAMDISEFIDGIDLPPAEISGVRVAYHAACSLQHGQKVTVEPKRLLTRAGFTVVEPADAHLCCGSAGTYNILQPDIAAQLGARKTATLEALTPDVIATGNIGCATQIAMRTQIPVVHMVQLLDWAAGGPKPF